MVLSDRVANLLEDRVDVAIRIGELPDSSLLARTIGAVELVVCASPAYLARRGTPRRPEDLGHHDCITFDGVGAPDAWIFRGCKPSVRVTIHSRLVVNTAEAAVDAAMAGLGITRVLSYQVARARSEGALRCVLGAFQSTAAPVHLVHTGQPLPPLKLRAFLDFATLRLKARIESRPAEVDLPRSASHGVGMTKHEQATGDAASRLIDQRIRELEGWRGETLSRMRALILAADPEMIEEWKWMGTPVWSHNGIVCTGESYTKVVKLTFARGAKVDDPAGLFNSSLEGNTRRAIDIHEGTQVDAGAFKALVRAAVAANGPPKKKR
jgi:hypothetical protein